MVSCSLRAGKLTEQTEMSPAPHTETILLLVGLTACGGRTEIMSGSGATTSQGTGGSALEHSSAGTTGGSLFAAGGASSADGGASGGFGPAHKTALSIATGAGHTCVLAADGTIECWGMNDSGELGDGTLIDRNVPSRVQGVSDASLVATAYDHTCAIVRDGLVKCWGSNADGQLGDGTSTDSAVPITVPGLAGVVQVDVGGLPGHTCALTNSGQVFCWGNAYWDANGIDVRKLALPRLVPGISSAVALSVGIAHSCAILSSGDVYCWGSNQYGQLGNGTTNDGAEPSRVQSAEAAILLAAGGNDTCTVTANLQVRCWGSNSAGQLGSGLAPVGAGFASMAPIEVDLLEAASNIAVGSQHACVTLQSGVVRCWGSNSGGELGDGTTDDHNQAVTTMGISNAIGVAAGGHHTCAIVEGGRLLCWGSNALGQLGDGTTNDSAVPLTVEGF